MALLLRLLHRQQVTCQPRPSGSFTHGHPRAPPQHRNLIPCQAKFVSTGLTLLAGPSPDTCRSPLRTRSTAGPTPPRWERSPGGIMHRQQERGGTKCPASDVWGSNRILSVISPLTVSPKAATTSSAACTVASNILLGGETHTQERAELSTHFTAEGLDERAADAGRVTFDRPSSSDGSKGGR